VALEYWAELQEIIRFGDRTAADDAHRDALAFQSALKAAQREYDAALEKKGNDNGIGEPSP